MPRAIKPITQHWLDQWMKQFEQCLREYHVKNPGYFKYGADHIPAVVEKMRAAFETSTYELETVVVQLTCITLDVKHTYKAINAYLRQPEPKPAKRTSQKSKIGPKRPSQKSSSRSKPVTRRKGSKS